MERPTPKVNTMKKRMQISAIVASTASNSSSAAALPFELEVFFFTTHSYLCQNYQLNAITPKPALGKMQDIYYKGTIYIAQEANIDKTQRI